MRSRTDRAPRVALGVLALERAVVDGQVGDRAGRLGQRNEPPILLIRKPLERREPVRCVRMTHEEHGLAVLAAVDAVRRRDLLPLGVALVRVDDREVLTDGRQRRNEIGWDRASRGGRECRLGGRGRRCVGRDGDRLKRGREVDRDDGAADGVADPGGHGRRSGGHAKPERYRGDGDAGGERNAEGPGRPQLGDATVSDGVLDPASAGLRKHECQREQPQAGRPREFGPDGGCREDQQRPVPEVERVRDPTTQRIGRIDTRRDTRLSGIGMPPATTSAAPRTGSTAAVPGNGVSVSKMTAPIMIIASPAPTATVATDVGRRASRVTPMARPAPMASSHARAGSRKKASGASLAVQAMPRPNDRTATTATTRPTRRTFARSTRDEEQERRPEQVELLLDAERPEMEQRRGVELGLQVIGRLRGEADVADVQRRRGAVGRDVRDAQRRQHDRRGDDGQRR